MVGIKCEEGNNSIEKGGVTLLFLLDILYKYLIYVKTQVLLVLRVQGWVVFLLP